jgi:hypothetical protein
MAGVAALLMITTEMSTMAWMKTTRPRALRLTDADKAISTLLNFVNFSFICVE